MRPRRLLFWAALSAACVPAPWSPPDGATALDAAVSDAPAEDSAPTDAPLPPCDGPTWRALACGYHGFCCAIRCEGSLWCWGANDDGQLGLSDRTPHTTPTRVPGVPRPARHLAAGYGSACAVLDDGSVWCWGGSPEAATAPRRIEPPLGPATGVACGGIHNCITLESGGVACWGGNNRFQLGNDGPGAQPTPTRVAKVDGPVAEVVCGQYHTCIRWSDGGVACWGQNVFGTLGNGAFVDLAEPFAVPLPAGARDLATQANHNLALLDDGALWSWGYNQDGQLGNGARTTSAVPVQAGPLPAGLVAVTAGGDHGCALGREGDVRCWGSNTYGQLGDGTLTRHTRPSEAVALDGAASAIAAGDRFTCALGEMGIRCWGRNHAGQLGDGTTQSSPTPVRVRVP